MAAITRVSQRRELAARSPPRGLGLQEAGRAGLFDDGSRGRGRGSEGSPWRMGLGIPTWALAPFPVGQGESGGRPGLEEGGLESHAQKVRGSGERGPVLSSLDTAALTLNIELRLPTCLPIRVCVHLSSICPSGHPSSHLPVHSSSIRLSLHPPIHHSSSVHSPINHLFSPPPTHPSSFYPSSIHTSIDHLFNHPSIHRSFHLFVHSSSIHPSSICSSIGPSTHPSFIIYSFIH